jgi:hypothetical protein
LSRLDLELAPSPRLAGAIVALHAAAAASLLAVVPDARGAALAAALLALGGAAAWSRALHRSARSIRRLELAGPELGVTLTSGASFVVRPGGRRYVSRWMVALPLPSPLRRTLLVTGDMLDADSFRRLRIWALWGKLPPEQGVAAAQLRP